MQQGSKKGLVFSAVSCSQPWARRSAAVLSGMRTYSVRIQRRRSGESSGRVLPRQESGVTDSDAAADAAGCLCGPERPGPAPVTHLQEKLSAYSSYDHCSYYIYVSEYGYVSDSAAAGSLAMALSRQSADHE